MKKPLLILIALFSLAPNCDCSALSQKSKELNKDLSDFIEAIDLLENSYIRTVDRKELIKSAIKGMIESLDPYSAYCINGKEFLLFDKITTGEAGGIGIEMKYDCDGLVVTNMHTNKPAHKAGIKIGDLIYEVNGKNIENSSHGEMGQEIRGQPDTIVKIKVYRHSTNQNLDLEIVRGLIKDEAVYIQIIGDSIIYAKIRSFSHGLSKEFKEQYLEVIKHLTQENKKAIGMVLDLRNNHGGLISECIELSDLFLNGSGIISITKSRKDGNKVHTARNSDITNRLPIVLLINEESASASEIFAAALKDNKRAVLIGKKSFGKGEYQKLLKLSSGCNVKITTGAFYSPSGSPISKIGIEPDIDVSNYDLDNVPKVLCKNRKNAKTMTAQAEAQKPDNIERIKEEAVKEEVNKNKLKIGIDKVITKELTIEEVQKIDLQLFTAINAVSAIAKYNSK